jgi:DNA (cytosine-5)-methyltransferase 1
MARWRDERWRTPTTEAQWKRRKHGLWQLIQGAKSTTRARMGRKQSVRWRYSRQSWPSRPGEQQFAWEPPRVVDTASARQQAQRDESNGQRREGFAGESSELGHTSSQRCEQDSALRGEQQPSGIGEERGLGVAEAMGNAASQREGRNENAEWQPSEGWDSAGDAGEAMGRPNSPRPQERPRQRAAGIQGADADGGEAAERQTQPPLGRDADGPADWLDDAELYTTCDNRTDELRLLGNGVVPAVAERAFRLLFGELTAHNTTQ